MKKVAGIGCLSVFGGLTALTILGYIVGPPPKDKAKPAAHAQQSAGSPTSNTVSTPSTATPTTAPPSPSTSPVSIPVTPSIPATPSVTATPPTPPATTATPPPVDLTFSGYVAGHVDQAVNIRPVLTGKSYDYEPSWWTTQCAIHPASDGEWQVNIAVQLNGITWQIMIDNRDFGSPKPGHYAGVPRIGSVTPGALGIDVFSDKNPNGVDNGSGIYGYYTPMAHGDADVTVNPGLTSGTLDIWLTPAQPAGYEVHIAGRWSCAP